MSMKGKKKDNTSVNYKARLEKKLCLAQETPEPVFDLSVCNLNTIPNNVFPLCRVLRKDALYLQNNNLSDLTSGGSLGDLKNLKVLNISGNRFSKLPSNINELESLEVLDVSRNEISELPETIGSLKNLKCLNLSYNNLSLLPRSIGNCSSLEILSLTYNENLKQLPLTLARLKFLTQLDIDSTIMFPPRDICSQGITQILKFLSKDLREDVDIPPTTSGPQTVVPYYDELEEKIALYEKLKLEKQNERLQLEKQLMNQNVKELELHQKTLEDRKKVLDNLKKQQNSLDEELIKLQEKKTVERALLIQLCQEEEKSSNDVVSKILNGKRNLQLEHTKEWENERKAEEKLLLSISTATRDLERKNILVTMEELMRKEIFRVQEIHTERKSFAVQSLAAEISQQNQCLDKLIEQRFKDSGILLEKLRQDEALQKSAVASLLEKSDEKWWELTQQIQIIESQLADLTKIELAKKRLNYETQVDELSKNRIALTELLMNLLDQQNERKKQLIQTMQKMETLRESTSETEMFWMQQFDKLLRSKNHEMVKFLETINPKFVHELYINGVFQYLPLLKNVGLSENEMRNLKDADLKECGITNAKDRSKILHSIKLFLEPFPSAPSLILPSAPMADKSELRVNPSTYIVSDDCVICVEKKPNVIFIPCGHICCCHKCYKSVKLCPICRRKIESCRARTNSD